MNKPDDPLKVARTPAERLAATSAREGRKAGNAKAVLWVCGLRSRRTALGLTLREVAGEIGMSLGNLGQVEQGLVSPSLDVALKLAAFYGAAVEELWEPVPKGRK